MYYTGSTGCAVITAEKFTVPTAATTTRAIPGGFFTDVVGAGPVLALERMIGSPMTCLVLGNNPTTITAITCNQPGTAVVHVGVLTGLPVR